MGWLLTEGTVLLVVAAGLGLALNPRCRPRLRRRIRSVNRSLHRLPEHLGLRATPPRPLHRRPIEVVAHEARRLGRLYRATRTGVSFAKSEAVRQAYDDVLVEGCEALGIPHLLCVLAPGDDLDTERARVERLLHIWGLDLDDAA
ncbi:hypothetical protein ACFP3Q_01925 [Nocardioides sp. GCM10027113]|uniref:hypothetical protein n=1 Tax=unclassified Nocardioides TaxID=2615069 RepID=UPI003615EEAF